MKERKERKERKKEKKRKEKKRKEKKRKEKKRKEKKRKDCGVSSHHIVMNKDSEIHINIICCCRQEWINLPLINIHIIIFFLCHFNKS